MKIVVLDDYADALRTLVGLGALAGHEVVVHRDPATGAALVERLQEAGAVGLVPQRVPLPAEVIERLPRLRFVSQTGRYTGHIDVEACTRRGILVSAGGGGPSSSTAELAWGLILAALRDIPRQAARLRSGAWLDSIGTTVAGRTLGIYAYGRIGSIVARVGAAFDMRVVCWGREGSAARAREAGFAVAGSRAEFFETADVVSLHLPLRDETRGIVTAADLGRMKPDALLVNTSRAGLIAPGVLVAALQAGRPGLAAIDVFEHEPVLGGADPLLGLPNVLCTPHLGYSTEAAYRPILEAAIEQLLAFAAGAPINVVNPAALTVRG